MTEQIDEAGAARGEKDKPEIAFVFVPAGSENGRRDSAGFRTMHCCMAKKTAQNWRIVRQGWSS